MQSLILNLAPTGMAPTQVMNPYVPISAEEIVQDCCKCVDMGVSILHLHARDADGVPTYRKEVYAKIIDGIRSRKPEAVICVSLSGRSFSEFKERSDPLLLSGDLRPDMASLTLSSLNFSGQASVNAPDTIRRLAEMMLEKGVKPELEVFDLGMLNYARYLLGKGVLKPPYYFNFLFGNVAGAQVDPLHLGAFRAGLPEGSIWACGGMGKTQLSANALGLIFADGVRIGLEDYLWMDDARQCLASNVSLVQRVLKLAEVHGRPIASCAEVRRRLGLKPT